MTLQEISDVTRCVQSNEGHNCGECREATWEYDSDEEEFTEEKIYPFQTISNLKASMDAYRLLKQ